MVTVWLIFNCSVVRVGATLYRNLKKLTVKNFGIKKKLEEYTQRGGKSQMYEQHNVICVTTFGTTEEQKSFLLLCYL